jgi:4-amino-4-deoxy-L-arabinose transferase-like glycosyltransferase
MSMTGKKSWNWSLWIGFLCVLAGFLTYTFFAQFPITRDFPWANLLLFAAGGILLVLGLFRAFGRPQIYRGKIFGLILAALGVNLTENIAVRARPEQVLEAFERTEQPASR